MKRCLNNPHYDCSGVPIIITRLHYDLVKQPDGSTKRIWHSFKQCSFQPYYCQLSKPCQLSLTTE